MQPGNCVGFGGAFKLPMVIKMEMPNPAPNSNSCDVNNCWRIQGVSAAAGNTGNQGGAVPMANVGAYPNTNPNNPNVVMYGVGPNHQANNTIKPTIMPPVA